MNEVNEICLYITVDFIISSLIRLDEVLIYKFQLSFQKSIAFG